MACAAPWRTNAQVAAPWTAPSRAGRRPSRSAPAPPPFGPLLRPPAARGPRHPGSSSLEVFPARPPASRGRSRHLAAAPRAPGRVWAFGGPGESRRRLGLKRAPVRPGDAETVQSAPAVLAGTPSHPSRSRGRGDWEAAARLAAAGKPKSSPPSPTQSSQTLSLFPPSRGAGRGCPKLRLFPRAPGGEPAPALAPALQPRRGGKVAVRSSAERTPRSEENRCPAPAHSAGGGRPVPTGTKRAGSRPAGEGPPANPHLGPSRLPRIPTPSARGAAHPAGALSEAHPAPRPSGELSWPGSPPPRCSAHRSVRPTPSRARILRDPASCCRARDPRPPRSARPPAVRPKARSLLCSDSSPGSRFSSGAWDRGRETARSPGRAPGTSRSRFRTQTGQTCEMGIKRPRRSTFLSRCLLGCIF